MKFRLWGDKNGQQFCLIYFSILLLLLLKNIEYFINIIALVTKGIFFFFFLFFKDKNRNFFFLFIFDKQKSTKITLILFYFFQKVALYHIDGNGRRQQGSVRVIDIQSPSLTSFKKEEKRNPSRAKVECAHMQCIISCKEIVNYI